MTTFYGLVLIFTDEATFAILKHQVGFSLFLVHDDFIQFCYVRMVNFLEKSNFIVDKLRLRLVLAEGALKWEVGVDSETYGTGLGIFQLETVFSEFDSFQSFTFHNLNRIFLLIFAVDINPFIHLRKGSFTQLFLKLILVDLIISVKRPTGLGRAFPDTVLSFLLIVKIEFIGLERLPSFLEPKL